MNADQKLLFQERQTPRISSFLPLLMLPPAMWLVGAPFNTLAGLYLGVASALLIGYLKIKNSRHIEVTTTHLILGDAKLPRKVLGRIELVEPKQQFFERGAKLDARAFVFLKYGLPNMVKVEVNDPKDPTPYVLISTRKAQELVKALN